MQYVKCLDELKSSDLPVAGGKAANLGALISAGLPVPGGFCLTTNAYQNFVEINGLEPRINQIINSTKTTDILSLENASVQIRNLFLSCHIPDNMVKEIRTAYAQLNNEYNSGHNANCYVAVRSSATAEDLTDMSFAGQQDTFLNITGDAALLESIVRCWASLWTARAIGYRTRNNILHDDLALAVVIQQMVQSEASGVLFTANPLTGKRTESVIDATIGLGEALVSGQVEPDHYVCDTVNRKILIKTIGAKAISIRGQSNGGTIMVTEDASCHQALTDEKIIELVELGRKTVDFFKTPQDIEWATVGDKIFLIQSRPITSLYPLPVHTEEFSHNDSLKVWFSFGSWQGMLDPFTPLGQDMFAILAVAIGKRLGFHMDLEKHNLFVNAGERLYINVTPIFRSSFGRKIFPKIMSEIEPAIIKPIETLFNDPRLNIQKKSLSLNKRIRIVSFLMPFVFYVIRNIINPYNVRERVNKTITSIVSELKNNVNKTSSLGEYLNVLESSILHTLTHLLPCILPAIISGQIPLQVIKGISTSIPDGQNLAMELTRGLPYNVTTEMDLILWSTANGIRSDIYSFNHFINTDTYVLAGEYIDGKLPDIAQNLVTDFMNIYGMRGIAEIDLGRPRWKEEPAGIMQVLKNYLGIENTDISPEAVFQKGIEKAKIAENQLIDALKSTKGGSKKSRIVKFMVKRVRELGGLRELPKFSVVKIFAVFRDLFVFFGCQMTSEGIFKQPEDIFYLHISELKALASGGLANIQTVVAQRRQIYENEKRRKSIPRLFLSDGTAFYEGMVSDSTDEKNVITGSPVSAGVVEGIIHVVTNPLEAQLSYGEIMVCPATDPAWTPLFLTAGGLIMEVGGMMTHGSVVAREYGIPAVVGVSQATTRLKTGQKVCLDGSSGKVYILEEKQI